MDTQEKYNAVFATRLRGLLDERKTTITTLANELGVSRQAVSQYTDGSTQPNGDKLVLIAKYFDVSTDYLLGLSDVHTTDADVQAIHKKTGLDAEAITQLMGWKREGENDLAQLVSYIAGYSRIMMIMSLIDDWLACPADESTKIQGVFMSKKTAIKAALNEESRAALNGYVKWLEDNFDIQTIKGRAGQLSCWQKRGKSWEVDNNG